MNGGTDHESDLERADRAATIASNVTVSVILLAVAGVVIWMMS